jgi:hypothetical protein
MAVITDAEKPSGLVRFVFLPALRELVQAASAKSSVPSSVEHTSGE